VIIPKTITAINKTPQPAPRPIITMELSPPDELGASTWGCREAVGMTSSPND
jgi:hypothetical protein